MASGHRHDQATWLLCLPFGLLCWPWLGLTGVASAAGGFLVGGLWLSPDLDTRSQPTRRWGPLALLWLPYRRLLRHRSLLSHSPVIGTAGRLVYLAACLLLIAVLLQPLGVPTPPRLAASAAGLWRQHAPLLLAAAAGLEASSWLHLLQDGDPMPRLPRVFRSRDRRRRNGRVGR
jgi:uncharacterized metal-binding protein